MGNIFTCCVNRQKNIEYVPKPRILRKEEKEDYFFLMKLMMNMIQYMIMVQLIYNIDFMMFISLSCVSIISFANFFNLALLVLLYILCDVVNAVE